MTVTAAADVPLAVVQEKLAEFDQWLPMDGEASLSVGQLVERNSTGPLRLGYGAWRDLLLGAQFYNGREELITAGGRTVKNVAGYDLTKFMVGQRGVFGRLVTITTRTYRRPAGAMLGRWDKRSNLAERIGFLTSLLPTDVRPQWALVDEKELLCGYLGDESTLRYYQGELPKFGFEIQPRTVRQDIELRQERLQSPFKDTLINEISRCRASVPPHRIGQFVHEAKLQRWIADPAFGVVWAAVDSAPQDEQIVQQAAIRAGGSAIIERPDGSIADLPLDKGVRSLLERLKASLDPDGKLAPLPWRSHVGSALRTET